MIFALFSILVASSDEFDGERGDINAGFYTMVKLYHPESKLYLSAIEFGYQGGSKQAMTRAIKNELLAEAFWVIWPIPNETRKQGEAVQCGDKIRLLQGVTRKYLHTHKYDGHFGQGWEVSVHDSADEDEFWEVQCNEDEWKLTTAVRLYNSKMKCYLSVNPNNEYKIEEYGEFEVYCSPDEENNEWFVTSGIYLPNDL